VHSDVERVLFSEQEIERGIERIAARITDDFSGHEFTAVAILKGSCIFASDLVRRIPIPIGLAFVYARSYRSGTTAGPLDLHLMPFEEEIRGKHLLLVDDILDSGRTMSAVKHELEARGAARVKTCVFLDKPSRRAVELDADYSCFEVDDLFVVGYGLDFAGRYRNLPYVAALKASVLRETVPNGPKP